MLAPVWRSEAGGEFTAAEVGSVIARALVDAPAKLVPILRHFVSGVSGQSYVSLNDVRDITHGKGVSLRPVFLGKITSTLLGPTSCC